MKFFLGIDTSNYTTSLCLLREDGAIIADQRQMLTVAAGERGLRQSEAVFQHVQNLPMLAKKLSSHLKEGGRLQAIAVSSQPRPRPDSYMPVFVPGRALAQSLASLVNVGYFEISHQENHIWSGIGSAGGPQTSEFLTIHLSGGTTELIFVKMNKEALALDLKLWGGTLDLHAGQFVDRLGVDLGLNFPAGPELENLALQAPAGVAVAAYHKDGFVSFSGPLTALQRLRGKEPPSVLARSCLQVISGTLEKWVQWAGKRTECRHLLIVGGVAANSIIRAELQRALPAWHLYFAAPVFTTDNACGAAYYAALATGRLPLGFKFPD